MKNVLLYYSFSFALGGGDYLPLVFAAELQKVSNLTLAVDSAENIERASKAFGISLDMVKEHNQKLFEKLGVTNRTEAVAITLRKHLLKI